MANLPLDINLSNSDKQIQIINYDLSREMSNIHESPLVNTHGNYNTANLNSSSNL